MKERPILFTGPMVRAILEGRKTVTRRAIKPPPDFLGSMADPTTPFKTLGAGLHGQIVCPYGQLGDRLWVRESWAADAQVDAVAPRDLSQGEPILYLADGGARQTGCSMITPGKARPSIHMPRWVSRILLEIVSVRVERLQDGDGETAFESRYIAEGINRIHHGDGEYYYHAFESEPGPGNWIDPFDAWRELWVSVNGVDSWATNPWVWVVEFKRLEVAHG
ncbi:hypothetical protein [Pseudomonas indica]|uniref:Morphogenetic protein n=1 Tax=Pseudomonas indica TaxID=137658 RepID=A0A1G8V429_9PSED|nr:hypothetical protein [Pseudomonas indica]SDJ60617.1 hypothetical protein SAMN05216186_10286 [Pseudomonas indica]